MAHNIGLYGQGLLDSADQATNDKQVAALVGSGFTTLMLFSMHVYPNGDLVWGADPFVSGGKIVFQKNPRLREHIAALRAGGFGTIQFSIGSADAADWTHIQALLATKDGPSILRHNFEALARFLGLDGFDFDCEEDGITPDTLASMTSLLSLVTSRKLITWSTYSDLGQEDWFLQGLQKVNKDIGRQLVGWWNLQVYDPRVDQKAWIDTLVDTTYDIGVADRHAFIQPGYDIGGGPSGACAQLAEVVPLGVQGSFIWQAGDIFDAHQEPKQYATALARALDGKPCG